MENAHVDGVADCPGCAELRESVAKLREHVRCIKTNPALPLQEHGPSQVCRLCYDELRVAYSRVAVIAHSIKSLVESRMKHGGDCPFCHGVVGHRDTCYLSIDAGRRLLDEYEAIEQHRDQLLELIGSNTAPSNSTALTIRDRFRRLSR